MSFFGLSTKNPEKPPRKIEQPNSVANSSTDLFDDLTNILTKLKTEYSNLKVNNLEIIKQSNVITNQLETANEENKVLSQQIEKIPQLNNTIKLLRHDMKVTVTRFKDDILKKQIYATELNEKNTNLERKLEDLSKELKNSETKCKELTEENSKIPTLKKEINELKEQLNQTHKKLCEQNVNCSIIRKENVRIPVLNEKLKQTSVDLEKEISRCTQLALDNEELRSNNITLDIENLSLRAKTEEANKKILYLNQKIDVLELKLKQTTLTLEKEIGESINLEVDNLNQKKIFENKETESENIKIKQLEEKLKNETLKNITLAEYNKKLDQLIHKFKSDNRDSPDSTENMSKSQENLSNCINLKVLIRDLPIDQLMEPLQNTVIALANKMSTSIISDDINKVKIMERKGLQQFSKNISLLVEFNNPEAKAKFLSNRNILKFNSSTKFIMLKEFIENEIYSVFLYANKRLRQNGFERVWYKDNKVFAVKNSSDAEEIEIMSKQQVDDMV